MPLLKQSPSGELEKTIGRAAEYRERAAAERESAERALGARDALAAQEAAGTLSADEAAATHRKLTDEAEHLFAEAERLEAVAVELDACAARLEEEIEAAEAATRRASAERASAKAADASRQFRAKLHELAALGAKLEQARERADELAADADDVELVDEPAWLDRGETDEILELIEAGPRTPNEDRAATAERLARQAAQHDEDDIRNFVTQIAQHGLGEAVWQQVPQRLRDEVERRVGLERRRRLVEKERLSAEAKREQLANARDGRRL